MGDGYGLVLGQPAKHCYTPLPIALDGTTSLDLLLVCLELRAPSLPAEDAVDIGCGDDFTAIVTASGQVLTCGVIEVRKQAGGV